RVLRAGSHRLRHRYAAGTDRADHRGDRRPRHRRGGAAEDLCGECREAGETEANGVGEMGRGVARRGARGETGRAFARGTPCPANQCSRSPGNGVTSTDSFELMPPSVADMFVMNSSLPLNTALALKSSALSPVPL